VLSSGSLTRFGGTYRLFGGNGGTGDPPMFGGNGGTGDPPMLGGNGGTGDPPMFGGNGGTGDPPIATNVGPRAVDVAFAATTRRTETAVATTSSARRNVRTKFLIWALLGETLHRLVENRHTGEPMPSFPKSQYIFAQFFARKMHDILSLKPAAPTSCLNPLVSSSHIFHRTYNLSQRTLQQSIRTSTKVLGCEPLDR
jgi:hypothetical protein